MTFNKATIELIKMEPSLEEYAKIAEKNSAILLNFLIMLPPKEYNVFYCKLKGMSYKEIIDMGDGSDEFPCSQNIASRTYRRVLELYKGMLLGMMSLGAPKVFPETLDDAQDIMALPYGVRKDMICVLGSWNIHTLVERYHIAKVQELVNFSSFIAIRDLCNKKNCPMKGMISYNLEGDKDGKHI